MQNRLLVLISFRVLFIHTLFVCLISLYLLPAQANEATHSARHIKAPKKAKTITDLRILVDISGSMKKTDPKNLRRSAVRLLAGLIPAGSRSGIWNFGKQVNMAVKIGRVTDSWRELARKQSKKINSVGLYTNIEGAMRKVSFDWKSPDPRYERNLILLTDGYVDISNNDELDKASRKRILKEILPRLEKANVKIHTIALSDDVDESLLSTLSAYTDGLYKKVSSADDLQKLFLQMLEQSANLDTLPIKGNRFNVDASIHDMTLLVFNRDVNNPTNIVTPGKKTWKKARHPQQVKWFRDNGFDLITIKNPQQGQWKILAPEDEDNRVVVATNLKLKASDIPGFMMAGDVLNIKVHLEEDEKPLSDERLLSQFKFILKRNSERAAERQYPLRKSEDDEYSYEVQLASIFKEGNNELVIQAKSPTAEREIRHQFKVYTTPAEIKISENHSKYKIEVIPYSNLIKLDTVKLSVELNDKTKHLLNRHNNKWSVEVESKYLDTYFTLNLNATRVDDNPISFSVQRRLNTKGAAEPLAIPLKHETQHQQEGSSSHQSEKNSQHGSEVKNKNRSSEHINNKQKENKVDDAGSEHQKVNWTIIISWIVAGNLLLIAIAAGGYFFMKRRKKKLVENMESLKEEYKKDDMKNDENTESENKDEK